MGRPSGTSGCRAARLLAAVWVLRQPFATVHERAETAFISWFAPVGISVLFHATLAEHRTGGHMVFVYATLAITLSVPVHGLSVAPFGAWPQRQEASSRVR